MSRLDVLLSEAVDALARAGIDQPEIDARLLLQHVTDQTRSQLVLHGHECADEETVAHYRTIIQQRAQRIPLQYLIGFQEFWSLDFKVTSAVLIPRPETEFLLEQVVRIYADKGVCRALDLCTGSGVIAIVLAKELGCSVTATDISTAALEIAAFNCKKHDVTHQVQLICSDLFTAMHCGRPFDLIVSNPPYIAEEEMDRLQPEVRHGEPYLALSGGVGGLQCLERIAAEAVCFLRPGGRLFVEIGADQKEAVMRMFCANTSHYEEVKVLNDWADRPRVLQARRKT
ncbi:peptide chain release factor N(5)-glutamine methyltransferase [Desulfobulbus oligotrophicus]|uniref:Release factor glutamine methyltransferase n=1 Tax=Desulfobulbus oligotrophicus TaxID=1909699 RepID=A0A7T6APA7_9BACT|nr:peptide chain release factor N(5)-glutamine methyltransferase [Desulfobulbus oligotrophicus]QQG64368.1 peptide chain release factor N(5)-glutamine methyltransferase [Desulfobulbus oligotrophicus]